MRLHASVLATAALALATSACGGGRPAASEISETLQQGVASASGSDVKLTEQQADCAAKVFLASDLSDDALRAIADNEEDYESSRSDERALATIRPQLAKCATG